MRLVLIFLLSSLLLACMVVFAVWWTVAPYKTCYNKGYQNACHACQWVDEHTGNIPTPSYIVEEP